MKTLSCKPFVIFSLLLFATNLITKSQTQKPDVVVTVGHSQMISTFAFSPDNTKMASASADNTLKIWDIASEKEFKTIRQNKKPLRYLQYADNGNMLITANNDYQITIRHAIQGDTLHHFQVVGTTFPGAGCDMLGKNLVFISSTFEICVANLQTKTRDTVPEYRVFSVIFHPEKPQQIVFCTLENQIIWYDLQKKSIIHQFANPSPGPVRLDIDSKGEKLLIASFSNLFVYDLNNRKLTGSISENQFIPNSAYFRPHRNQIFVPVHVSHATKGQQTGVYVYDAQTLKLLRKITGLGFISPTGYMQISSDGKLLALASVAKSVVIVDIESGKPVKRLQSHAVKIQSVQCNFGVPKFAVLGYDQNLRFWDLKLQKIEKVLPYTQNFYLDNRSKRFITYGYSPKSYTYGINQWHFDSYKNIAEIPLQTGLCSDIMLHSTKKQVLITGMDQKIDFWSLKNKQKTGSITPIPAGVGFFSANPSFQLLATSAIGNDSIFVYDLQHKAIEKKLYQLANFSMQFSHNGSLLATGGVQKITLWDSHLWKSLHQWEAHQGIIPALAFSREDMWLASASGSNPFASEYPVKIWNTKNTEIKCELYGHTSHISSLAFYNDTIILSGSFDAMVKVWDIKNCKLLASLVAIDSKDYIIITPDHYYTGSKGSLKGIGFRYNNRLYPFEQFDLILNRPDIVAGTIGIASPVLIEAYHRAYNKRIEKLGFDPKQLRLDFEAPELRITNAQKIPAHTDKELIKFHVETLDKHNSLDRINVWINNVPVYGKNGIPVTNKKGKIIKQLELQLVSGKNKIQFSCMNQKGVESLKQTFYVNCTALPIKPDLYIVAIGVSEYQNKEMNLKYAAKDARDFVNLFKKHTQKYANIFIDSLINKEANVENILAAKTKLLQSKPRDLVMVFIAGHGLLDKNLDYYLATHDVDFSNPAINGLSYNILDGLLDSIPARKKIMLIDACHSGEIDKDSQIPLSSGVGEENVNVVVRGFKPIEQENSQNESKSIGTLGLKNSFELMRELFADLRQNSGAVVISSAGGAEFAFESDRWNNGVFTYCALDALQNGTADRNTDNIISITEWRNYIINQVRHLTNERQNPTSRQENYEFDFSIW